jgi:ABC-2 type transport system permease protein
MHVQRAMIYRVRALIWLLYDLLVPFIMIVFFKTVIQTPDQQIKGFYLENLITYYLLISVFNPMVSTHLEEDMEKVIKSGEVSQVIIKPTSFLKMEFARELAYKSYHSVLVLFVVTFFFILFGQYFKIQLTPFIIIFAPLALILSFLIHFLISFLVGLLCFWLEEIVGFYSLKEVLISLFSGAVLPLEFFPEFINKINNLLPFKYLLYFPVSIVQGKISPPSILSGVLIQIIWVFILFLSYKIFYPKTLKHYSAVGG